MLKIVQPELACNIYSRVHLSKTCFTSQMRSQESKQSQTDFTQVFHQQPSVICINCVTKYVGLQQVLKKHIRVHEIKVNARVLLLVPCAVGLLRVKLTWGTTYVHVCFFEIAFFSKETTVSLFSFLYDITGEHFSVNLSCIGYFNWFWRSFRHWSQIWN